MLRGYERWVWAVAFSPDGRRLASGDSEGTICLWEAQTGKQLRRFTGHEGYVTSLVFAPDGKTLVSVSDDGTALLWNTEP